MRHICRIRVAAPLLIGVLMVGGCSREVDESEASDRRKYAGGRIDQIVALRGCVEGAPDPKDFVLRNVQLEPMLAQPSDAATSAGLTVTEGSSVRLHMTDPDQLRQNLGQVVSVTGTITSDGRNTIGTAGRPRDPDQQDSPTDASRAATNEHYSDKQAKEAGPLGQESLSNGTVPRMSVHKVTATGERCKLELRPESRTQ